MPTASRRALLKFATGAALLAGCTTQSDTTTESPTRTPTETAERTPTATDTPREFPDSLAWVYETGGEVTGAPVVTDDAIYVRVEHLADTPNDQLHAVDPTRGEPLWTIETAISEITGSPITVEDALYFVQESTTRAGITGAAALAVEFSGERRWTFEPDNVGHMKQYGFDAANDLVLLGTYGGRGQQDDPLMFAVDATTGNRRWRQQLGGILTHVQDGKGFVSGYVETDGGNEGTVRSFDLADGTLDWEVKRDGHIAGHFEDSIVLSSWKEEQIYALATDDGRQRWHYDLPELDSYRELKWSALAGDTLYAFVKGRIVALDASDGSLRWRSHRFDSPVGNLEIVTDETLYTYSHVRDRTVSAFDIPGGTKRWEWSDETSVWGVTPWDDFLYVTGGTRLQALDVTSGEPIWRFDTAPHSGSHLKPAGVSVDHLYVGDERGSLYAFEHPSSRKE